MEGTVYEVTAVAICNVESFVTSANSSKDCTEKKLALLWGVQVLAGKT